MKFVHQYLLEIENKTTNGEKITGREREREREYQLYSNEDRTAGIIVKANRLHSTRSLIVFYCAKWHNSKWFFLFHSFILALHLFFQVQRPDVLAMRHWKGRKGKMNGE